MKPSDYIRKGWTHDAFARDKYGHPCDPTEPKAQKWCMVGAIHAAYKEPKKRDSVKDKIRKRLGENVWMLDWNDTHKKEDVLHLLESVGE